MHVFARCLFFGGIGLVLLITLLSLSAPQTTVLTAGPFHSIALLLATGGVAGAIGYGMGAFFSGK